MPDPAERNAAFAAVENIPSIRRKADFCMKWLDSIQGLNKIETRAERRQFLLNLICFAACIEGLFFFGAFAYVYFLRSRGLLPGLAAGTNWVFRGRERSHGLRLRCGEDGASTRPLTCLTMICGARSRT